ncbi:hypothetical protein BDZ97DRAFT_1772899 [Flammula alnicola]|nr:hypothetical protein BDZ97DRAFT_1772899 [Flammula alnicola]
MDPQRVAATAAAAYDLVQDALMSPHDRIRALLESLPVLTKDMMAGVGLEEPCPICLTPFLTVFEEAEGEGVQRQEDIAEEAVVEFLGVTKLVGCGHVFCRRDLTEWIRSQHGSCPTCRHTFLNIRPPSESDDESSDGGEYIPNPDDFEDEDEDAFLDVDGFTDTDADDFPVEGMDLDFDDLWEEEQPGFALGVQLEGEEDAGAMGDAEMEDEDDGDYEYEEEEGDGSSEWGLTDGESESMSSSEAGDTTMENAAEAANGIGMWPRRGSASRVVQLTIVALLLFSAGPGG